MKTLDEALRWLDRHANREIVPTPVAADALAGMRRLATALGDPQLDVPVIQITGTNGKGSVAMMITHILATLGLRVGTYTSPHIDDVRERIRFDGQPIEPDDLALALGAVRRAVDAHEIEASWFDIFTATAYWSFADHAVDVAVVEVGMLGRYDSTSIVDPIVAVVTNVGYDHTDGRAGWRRAIAWEKAGIISPNSILCLGETDPEIEDVFSSEGPASVLRRHDDFDCVDNVLAIGGRMIALRSPTGLYEELYLPLHGEHQGDNAALALAAAEAFMGMALPHDVVEEGLAAVTMPGRLEVLGHDPLVIVDGSHNPPAAEAAIESLEAFGERRRILVVGSMADKNVRAVLEALDVTEADVVICTQADSPRAMPAAELAALVGDMGGESEVVIEPDGAMGRALALAGDDALVLCTGSLWLVGAMRRAHASVFPEG